MIVLSFPVYCLLIITLCRSETNSSDFRLPKSVVPVKYILNFFPVLQEVNFIQMSTAIIKIRCVKSTNTITLHSRDLEIMMVNVSGVKHKPEMEKFELEPKYDFLHIYLKEDLTENAMYTVNISFMGKINQELSGLYKSYYMDNNGSKIWLAATHFEPISARAAFPCFDEPQLKAKFKISIGHTADLLAISNMPLQSSYNMSNSDWDVLDTFETSVKMSTYLVAFVISDFKYETTYKNNSFGQTKIRIYARKNYKSQMKFAKSVAPRALSFFEEYFDLAFPLPKADFVAIPDFGSSGMENWGLIMFREVSLLFDPKVSSLANKQRIVYVMAHELAHMWFGNLVTMKWWDDTWLKEGFATYLGNIGMAHLFPKWKRHFLKKQISVVEKVYDVDALQQSRPISVPIMDPNLIIEIYDGITYSKGACVIVMMQHFLGPKVLQKGLRHYLNAYKYGNAEKDQLWKSMSAVIKNKNALPENQTLNEIMDTWIIQPGYPLITVFRDYKGTIRVTQQRFLENNKKTDKSCYWIPLTYTTEHESDFTNTKPKHWMSCPKKTLSFKDEHPNSWIIFNMQLSGLYRTNYDNKTWNMLIQQLENNHTKIDVASRVILIEDVMELAINGHLSFKLAFNLTNYVRHDKEVVTWSKVLDKLECIGLLLRRTASYELVQTHIMKLVQPFYKRLNNKENVTKLEVLILKHVCQFGNEQCKKDAAEMFHVWMKNKTVNPIPEIKRPLVYCYALKNGGVKEWDFLWKQYVSSQVGSEQYLILRALACAQENWLLNRYLKWIVKKDSGIRDQDAPLVFNSVATNPSGSNIARRFFYAHVKDIYDAQSPKGKQMKKYMDPLLDTIQTEKEIEEFQKFVTRNEEYLNKVQLAVNRSLERLEIRNDWFKNQYYKVEQVLFELHRPTGSSPNQVQTSTHKPFA